MSKKMSIKTVAAIAAASAAGALGLALTAGSSAAGEQGRAAAEPTALPAATTFGVLADQGRTAAQLPAPAREAIESLGAGYGRASSGDKAADGAAIARGEGTVVRVDHSAGLTVLLVAQGSSLCTLALGAVGGAGCGDLEVDPAEPPISVTTETDGERVVAILPDGATSAQVGGTDGTVVDAPIERNVAVGRVDRAASITWIDGRGTTQRLDFAGVDDDRSPAALAGRATEIERLIP